MTDNDENKNVILDNDNNENANNISSLSVVVGILIVIIIFCLIVIIIFCLQTTTKHLDSQRVSKAGRRIPRERSQHILPCRYYARQQAQVFF